jgi:LysR family transcriptional regulator, nitrogen assimilation regulatory protein
MTPSIGQRIIPDYISRFSERFPRASLSIVEGYSQALAEQVVMGKLDFAFPLNPQASPNLVIEPVGAEVLYLIGAEPIGDNSEQVDLFEYRQCPAHYAAHNAHYSTAPGIRSRPSRRHVEHRL